MILSCCNFVFWKINLIYLSAGDKDVTESILPRDTFPGQIRLIRAVNSEQHQYQYPRKYFAPRHIFCEIRILAANTGADGCHARSTIFPGAFCQLLEFVQHIGYFSFARNERARVKTFSFLMSTAPGSNNGVGTTYDSRMSRTANMKYDGC